MRYQTYPEYKDSGVDWLGKVPNHWVKIPLKYLLSKIIDNRGRTPPIFENGIPLLELKQICADIHPSELFEKFINNQGKRLFIRDDVKGGDILFGTVGSIGKCCIVPQKSQFVIAQNIVGFRTGHRCQSHYFYYLLLSDDFKGCMVTSNKGNIQDSIKVSDIIRQHTQIPPYDEQTIIANFLDRETTIIDNLISKQQKLISLLQEKRQAVISHAVTKGINPDAKMKDSGVEWLGEVPEHWIVGRYKFCASRVVVGIAEAATHAYADVGVPIIRSTNVKEEGLDTSGLLYIKEEFAEQNHSKYLYANDVITVRTGYPGTSAVIPGYLNKSQCFTNLIATPRKSFLPDFMAEYLNSHAGKSYFELLGWGSAQKNISVPILQNIPIAYPSTKEQFEIVTFVKDRRKEFSDILAKVERQVALLQERRTALISAAVTGKIDVRNA
jgi:type I restriction enzyme S subunit